MFMFIVGLVVGLALVAADRHYGLNYFDKVMDLLGLNTVTVTLPPTDPPVIK